MSQLFQPFPLRELTAKNRLVVSPMCQYSSELGYANDWHLVHLGTRAVGGAGIVVTEATAVAPEGRISPRDLGLWEDGQVDKLKQITAFLKAQAAIPAIQLAHAGRKASCQPPWDGGKQLGLAEGGWECVAPSPMPFHEGDRAPRAATPEDLRSIVEQFASAAARALQAGFQIAEIHAAHGYLLHEFHSPVSNHRQDEYGGSLENRTRLTREVVEAVRAVWPEEWPIFVRISADDWLTDRESWTIEDSVWLSKELKKLGVEVIDVSSAGIHPAQKIAVGAGYQVPFAARIRRESGIAVGAVGMITEAAQAESLLRTEQADLIFMARELLRNPYFPLEAMDQLHEKSQKWPKQYARARRK
ncbi:MAG: NADH:flavin oxidoreductase/NADH oxidase [Bacteroidota bacterium]